MDKALHLKRLVMKIRIELLKEMIQSKGGHIGGSLSIVETLAVLYGGQLKYDPKNPNWDERDYVILSKGHAGPAWYAVLALSGYFDTSVLLTLNQGGTKLPSHPDRLKIPGVDMTNGSLGQGASVGAGIAYDLKQRDKDQYVYVIVGDGELNEGQNWEAFQFIAHHRLHNCIIIIDENKKQLDGFTKDIIEQFSLAQKMQAFGFHVTTVKGDDACAIDEAVSAAKANKASANCILLDSVKGQGIPYFAELFANHSVKFGEKEEAIAKEAIVELEKRLAEDV